MPTRKLDYETEARLFKALMHPARLAILEVLRSGEACVCHMEAALGYRQAYLSQQLMVLREAGIVSDRRDGWNVYYRVTRPGIFDVMDAAQRSSGQKDRASVPAVVPGCTCPHCAEKAAAQASPLTTAG